MDVWLVRLIWWVGVLGFLPPASYSEEVLEGILPDQFVVQVEAMHNDIEDTPNSEVYFEITNVFAIEQAWPVWPSKSWSAWPIRSQECNACIVFPELVSHGPPYLPQLLPLLDHFYVSVTTGKMFTNVTLDCEAIRSYCITVTARNLGVPQRSR